MFLYRWTWGSLVLTFALLLLGGIVHATGSSLACPDWPLCYGQVFPEMRGGVAIEHSHRLLASLVGLCTVVLTIGLARRRDLDRTTHRLGYAALFLVVFQGVLGGITVLFRLPLAVSTAHLATSMVFFAVLVVLAFRLRRTTEPPLPKNTPRVRWLTIVLASVYAQLVLGALVRHTGSGLSCGNDVVRCSGELWPAWAPGQLHMMHRFVALWILGLLVIVGTQLWRTSVAKYRRFAVVVVALVLSQITLGLASVLWMLSTWVVTAHLGMGAALFGTLLWLRLLLKTNSHTIGEAHESTRRAVPDRPLSLTLSSATSAVVEGRS